MAEAGFSVVFLRMMDSPGNYLVVMRRSKEAVEERTDDRLKLPCSYTGKVISAAGTYQHATLVWHPIMSEDVSPEKHWVDRVRTLLAHD